MTKTIVPNNSISEFTFAKLKSHIKPKNRTIPISSPPTTTNKVPTITIISNNHHYEQENTNIQNSTPFRLLCTSDKHNNNLANEIHKFLKSFSPKQQSVNSITISSTYKPHTSKKTYKIKT